MLIGKMNFCSVFLPLSVPAKLGRKTANYHLLFRGVRSIEISRSWLRCVNVLFVNFKCTKGDELASLRHVSPMYFFLSRAKLYSRRD